MAEKKEVLWVQSHLPGAGSTPDLGSQQPPDDALALKDNKPGPILQPKPKVDPNIAALNRVKDEISPRYAEVDQHRNQIGDKPLLKEIDQFRNQLREQEEAKDYKAAVLTGRELLKKLKAAQEKIHPEGQTDLRQLYEEVARDFDQFKKMAASIGNTADTKKLLEKIAEAEALYKAGSYAEAYDAALAAAKLFDRVKVDARTQQASAEKSKDDDVRKKKEAQNAQLGKEAKQRIGTGLAAFDKGDPTAIKAVYQELAPGKSDLLAEELNTLRAKIVGGLLQNKDRRQALAADPPLCADFLMTAGQLGVLSADMLKDFGDKKSEIAQKVLLERCTASKEETGETLHQWMWESVDLKDWNDKQSGKGVAAQVYNQLWNAGQFDQICALVKQGVDPLQAHNLGINTGRGSTEGVWSGYIQPLEHLLGNYVRKVYLFQKNPKEYLEEVKSKINLDNDKKRIEQRMEGLTGKIDPAQLEKELNEILKTILDKEAAKVQGAEKILGVLSKSGTEHIITSYEQVQKSPAMQEFKKNPGTIWGFEDVRLPYVQSAHETEHGNQPLRMWEMWKAIENALDEPGYERLLENPDEAIPKFVDIGLGKMKDEVPANTKEYPNVDVAKFADEFRAQATAYLKMLASQKPKGEFDSAAASGVDPSKLMGGLGCKAGLWWAKENKKPVYYCLDGIDIEDALSYKRFKNAKINAYLDDPDHSLKHLEVITFAEIREILKHWNELKGTIKFIEKGSVMNDPQKVEGWRKKMADVDQATGKRPAPKADKFKTELDEIDPELLNSLKAAADADRNALRIVRKTRNLIRAAKAKNDNLFRYREKDWLFFYEWGILPGGFHTSLERLRTPIKEGDREQILAGFRSQLSKVCKALKEPLLNKIDGLVRTATTQ